MTNDDRDEIYDLLVELFAATAHHAPYDLRSRIQAVLDRAAESSTDSVGKDNERTGK